MAADPSTNSSMGSAAWTGSDTAQIGNELDQRASKFLNDVNWDRLGSVASQLRDGMPCQVNDRFSIGHFNMVRRITFADQVSWVARLRMPPVSVIPSDREAATVARIMEVEVAGMKFLRAKTDIPVPSVHAYDTDETNDIGAPYILMDYIHGTVAYEMRFTKNYEPGLFGTREQDRRFKQEMAKIQTTLASFTFSQIGSLYHDPPTGEFFIGPDIETDRGPWVSSADYFSDLTQHCLRVCVNNAPPDVLASPSFSLPVIFSHLMKLSNRVSLPASIETHPTPFCLTNRDLGPHNLLVDEDFHIVGVIDLDGIMAAPYEVAAQFPVLAGLDPEPPGCVETKPMVIQRIARAEPLIREYCDIVKEVEESANESKSSIGNLMFSNDARVFQGLRQYKSHQKLYNDKWMDVYTRMLVDHHRDAGKSASNQQ